MNIVTSIFAFTPLNTALFTQEVLNTGAVFTPRFFIAVFAGVVLALTFQLLLTVLSVACGISMVGNVKEKYVHSKVHPSDEDDDKKDSSGSTGVKISTGFGVWNTVTSCIAVFGGTALALQLDIFNTLGSRITLALVIWGLFFIILFYLESKIISTAVGGLLHTATAGLKSTLGSVKDMFTPSEQTKVNHTIETAISKIRDEFENDFDTSKISGVLDNFLNKAEKKIPDYDKLKKDLKDIVNQSNNSGGSGNSMAIQQVLTKAIDENADSDDEESKGKVAKLKSLLEETKKAYDEGDGKTDKVKNAVGKITGEDKEGIDKKMGTIKDYLLKLTPDNIQEEDLEREFKKILDDPKSISSVVSSNFEGFDKDSLVSLMEKNTNLDKEQLDGYASQIRSVLEKVTSAFNGDGNNEESLTKRAEGHVADYLNSTGKKELNFDDLKADLGQLIDNPKDGLNIIKGRLAKFDSDTIKALVTNNKYIDESQIDSVLDTIENSKKTVSDKVKKIEMKAREEMKMIERKAVIQAEHLRKTAATAAWWLVASIVISGGAAILGSLV